MTWFLNFSQKYRLSINRVPDGMLVPNLVQIGQETAEKRWREKRKKKSKSTEKHNITEILKIAFLQKRQYKNE